MIPISQRADSPGASFEIVDQQSCRKMNLFCEPRLLDHPWQIGSFHAAIPHRASDSKASRVRMSSGIVKKSRDNLTKIAVLAAGKDAFRHQAEMPVLGLKVG